jgi:thiol-disulfide isomerase/thioredoxin
MKFGQLLWICVCLTAVGCPGDPAGTGTPKDTTPINDAPPAETPDVESPTEPHEGNVELSIMSWQDAQQRVVAHAGKVVVLDAWSTSCGPCMKEFPNLVALHEKHGGGDVVCMSVSVDYDGIPNKPPEAYRERVLKFLTKKNATLENILLNTPADDWYTDVDLAAIPAVFVFGRDGKLVKRFDNDNIDPSEEGFTYEDVNGLVEELLAQE